MIIDNKMACSERSRNAERGYESTDANSPWWLKSMGRWHTPRVSKLENYYAMWDGKMALGEGYASKSVPPPKKKWWTVKSKDMLDQTLVLSDLCIWKKTHKTWDGCFSLNICTILKSWRQYIHIGALSSIPSMFMWICGTPS
jgi:hypothetical protein